MGERSTEIRFLDAADAIAYSKIRSEALEFEPEAFGSSLVEHHRLTVEDIAARLSFDPQEQFVVGGFAREQLVGTAGFVRNKGIKERHKGRIWGVYVAREARGKGIGRAMMRVLLKRAAKIDGVEQLLLSVTTAQSAAAGLYRSLGFEAYGCEPRALRVGERYIDEEHMVLLL